ncbi:hypothetical protein BV22DRAFT_1020849 [Leucogyrophana mollusca]|uniref:Uncharacterized protein n=1 Tax=Leucogyrophana mollusca TaxID=85980 RepID=A0ACB8B5Y2_9AGAM|nr:hypothetical protein BV22DRAFT_1020849 [Leucogyrophana mollusca]
MINGKRQAEKKTKKDEEAERHRADIQRKEIETFGQVSKADPGVLSQSEAWWRDRYRWLKERGYQLRPRYDPDWKPSWFETKKDWFTSEDGEVPWYAHILDATRITDGSFVTLKLVSKSRHPYEVDITRYFSSEPIASNPANHCIPVIDVLQVPDDDDDVLLVLPLLREYSDPRFDTVGEAIECFRQLFEGMQFIHQHHVAHRDCMNLNIMMDAKDLYIDSFHPCQPRMRRDFKGEARHYTRTQRPPRYFFIDFGISRRYDASDTNPLEYPIWGGDKTVPEFQKSNAPCNPFPTDVYYLGNFIREDFLQAKMGFEFMEPLVNDMVQDDPAKRPTMDQVVERFDAMRKELSSWKLRSRVVTHEDSLIGGLFRGAAHWARRINFIAWGVPPVPN